MVINYLMTLFGDIEHFHQELFSNQNTKFVDAEQNNLEKRKKKEQEILLDNFQFHVDTM
jgi:hypothetical protein